LLRPDERATIKFPGGSNGDLACGGCGCDFIIRKELARRLTRLESHLQLLPSLFWFVGFACGGNIPQMVGGPSPQIVPVPGMIFIWLFSGRLAHIKSQFFICIREQFAC
jgi:hypothetical protein